MFQKSKPLTVAVIGFDETASMRSKARVAVDAYNAQIDSLRMAGSTGQQIEVEVFPIRERACMPKFSGLSTDELRHMEYYEYVPNAGGTAIVDGCLAAIERAQRRYPHHPNIAYLFIVVTDGEENVSYNKARLGQEVRRLTATDRWTFAFSVPNGHRAMCRSNFGIEDGNILEWDVRTDEGFRGMAQHNVQATQSYFTERAKGATATRSFYTTNITPEKSKKLDRFASLHGVTPGKYREIIVPQDMSLKDYFKDIVKRPFSVGRIYYELTKPEEVQPHKVIVLQDRTDKTKLYDGSQAREILELPTSVNCKVNPGVHGKWRIFVQSKSNNRNLVGGTVTLFQ